MTTDSSPETKPTSTLTRLKQAIASSDPTERYWGLVGLRLLGEKAAAEAGSLLPLLKDKHAAIRTTAAQALYAMGKKDIAAKALVTDVASEMEAPPCSTSSISSAATNCWTVSPMASSNCRIRPNGRGREGKTWHKVATSSPSPSGGKIDAPAG
jgi:hypothetical protein